MNRIVALLNNDPYRLRILKLVSTLGLQDCYVAAGFVRNMVWDHIHNFPPTELNDIDVIYYAPADVNGNMNNIILAKLKSKAPDINWQVKNQASMHIRNGDREYESVADAMSFWPEKETAVAAKLNDDSSILIVAPFGVESLFAGMVSFNAKRSKSTFMARVESKKWLQTWPNLKVVS